MHDEMLAMIFKTLISQDDMLKKKTLIRLYVKVHRFLKSGSLGV